MNYNLNMVIFHSYFSLPEGQIYGLLYAGCSITSSQGTGVSDEAGQGGSIGHSVGPGHGAAEGWRVFNVVGLVNNGEPQTIGGKFGFIPKY